MKKKKINVYTVYTRKGRLRRVWIVAGSISAHRTVYSVCINSYRRYLISTIVPWVFLIRRFDLFLFCSVCFVFLFLLLVYFFFHFWCGADGVRHRFLTIIWMLCYMLFSNSISCTRCSHYIVLVVSMRLLCWCCCCMRV